MKFVLVSTVVLLLLKQSSTKLICNESDCYSCDGENCDIVCQGEACLSCPDGSCCYGDNCNVCVKSLCCDSKRECNECVIANRDNCTSNVDCDNWIMEECDLNIDNQISPFMRNDSQLINQGYNTRTIVNIQNVMNYSNILDIPISIQQTNIKYTNTSDIMSADNQTDQETGDITQDYDCCTVIHARECHKFTHIPREVCFTRKHSECSVLCGNGTNLLIKKDGHTQMCIDIQAVPYYYCGYYRLEDCSACYDCEDLSEIKCTEQSECSPSCREAIIPAKFYNRPYYIGKI